MIDTDVRFLFADLYQWYVTAQLGEAKPFRIRAAGTVRSNQVAKLFDTLPNPGLRAASENVGPELINQWINLAVDLNATSPSSANSFGTAVILPSRGKATFDRETLHLTIQSEALFNDFLLLHRCRCNLPLRIDFQAKPLPSIPSQPPTWAITILHATMHNIVDPRHP